MDVREMKTNTYIIVDMATEELTNLELAVLNNVAQLNLDPRNRLFDYEKVKSLFTQDNGMQMHEETKSALATVVGRRLGA
jgi:hypothetical protein